MARRENNSLNSISTATIWCLDNYQIHHSIIGDLSQPTILFLHGFMGNLHEFDLAISLLKDDFSCLVLDLPGHGKTQVLGNDESYNMENTAKAVINLLDNLQISKCFLVGYSMGGRLGLYLTLNYPDYFPKVILESASPGLATFREQLKRQNQDHQIARKLTRLTQEDEFLLFLKSWYTQPIFGNIKDHPQFDDLIRNRLNNNPGELAKSLQIMGTGSQPPLWNQLTTNTQPILLLVGTGDPKFIEINQTMVKTSPTCQLKQIHDAAHNTHFENVSNFVTETQSFLIAN
jgi:2-succinyl-6-hydroxy-2,4-cyclohexadiene-1-carboxylate synthase